MHAMLTTNISKVPETRGLELIQATRRKTKTFLMIRMDNPQASADYLGTIARDIALLGAQGHPLTDITLTVEGVQAFGWLIRRSTKALGKAGVQLNGVGWDASTGLVRIKGTLGLLGIDLPVLCEIFGRLVARGLAPRTSTRYPLTLYDLQQLLGIVYDIKQGAQEFQQVLDWFAVRELIILEDAQEAEVQAVEQKKKDRRLKARREIVKKAAREGVTVKK